MAYLATHLSASLFLVPTGLTRLLRSTSLFLKNPSLFRSKPWFTLSHPQWKNLDLFALALALPIAALSEAFLASALPAHPARRFALAHHSVVLVLFSALVLSVAFRHTVDFFRSAVNDGLVFVLAGVSFLSEYWVAENGTEGLSKDVYGFLGLLSLLCGVCSLYLAVNPASFWAEFLLSSGLVFKGTWALQIGVSLYTDTFGFKGCGLRAENLSLVVCELEEDGLRAVALARLMFVWHSCLVFGLGLVSFGLLSLCQRRRSRLGADQDGALLSQLEAETALTRNGGAELEME